MLLPLTLKLIAVYAVYVVRCVVESCFRRSLRVVCPGVMHTLKGDCKGGLRRLTGKLGRLNVIRDKDKLE